MGLKNEHSWIALGTLVLTLGVFSGSASAQYVSDQALNEQPILLGLGGQVTAASDNFTYSKVGPAELGLALPGAPETLKPGESANLEGQLIYVGGQAFLVPGQKLAQQRTFTKANGAYESVPFAHKQEN